MKSILFTFFIVLFVSCESDDTVTKEDYTAENEQEILNYMSANNLEATRSDSGLYYVIDEVGDGEPIFADSQISVRYKATYTDGKLLEKDAFGSAYSLKFEIEGWIEGLQHFNVGGRGTLIIPAHLAYGSYDTNSIPGGSVIVYNFEIIDLEAENNQDILNYIEDNSLIANASETGLYYVIDEEGTGERPTNTSKVTFVYTAYYTDGTIYKESPAEGVTYELNLTILGLKEGLQKFKEGGSGTLLIPSALSYGPFNYIDYIGGSVLIYDVDLLAVN
ncbi:FKBP-type peptidyl-prolyl cis-trans isomerase [Formosa sp. PL04]|uniref:FKBP-type peptidyl-prolyl cis-trans isomerase n=1 Tax=Formosa sp. PL04 TaxID=3081755 RepID=UPI0029816BE9|nr:FKBP-type peptidyl-prolyl cis-trans isomerase [Formosa sp. PL04]MDW5288530.1 FKBP-type peptidyl-prolyl cis-trans isomerase [Formosa sp. PL04]